jgi:hypothetical protein
MTKYDQSFDVDAPKSSMEIGMEWDKRKAMDGTILLRPNSDWRMERQFIKAIIAGYERLTEDGCTLELTIGPDSVTIKKVSTT